MIDTSIWVDYFNKKNCSQYIFIDSLIDTNKVITLPVIMQEILQGISDDAVYNLIMKTLLDFKIPRIDYIHAAIQAASLFRNLRKKGISIRKPNDCLIAAICLENNFAILHNDKDFDNIAKHTSLKIYKP